MNQIHFIAAPSIAGRGSDNATARQIIAQGEFRGLVRWMTSPYPSRAPERAIGNPAAAGIDAQGEYPREGNDGLGALLAAIDDDVRQHEAAARNGILADFAGRVAHARKHLSRHLLAGALATIKEQRKAALALITRNAALELAGRRKAAIETLRPSKPQRPRSSGSGPYPSPPA